MEELLRIKELLKNNELLCLETTNNKTGWIGVASFFTNGEDKIRVYEGSGDGSDDKDLTFDEFLKNYTFELKEE